MVYQMACKTIFICFLEDERRNDGSKSRPYAMSVDLFKLLTTVQPKKKRLGTKTKAIMPKTKDESDSIERIPRPTPSSVGTVRIHKNRKYVSAIRWICLVKITILSAPNCKLSILPNQFTAK